MLPCREATLVIISYSKAHPRVIWAHCMSIRRRHPHVHDLPSSCITAAGAAALAGVDYTVGGKYPGQGLSYRFSQGGRPPRDCVGRNGGGVRRDVPRRHQDKMSCTCLKRGVTLTLVKIAHAERLWGRIIPYQNNQDPGCEHSHGSLKGRIKLGGVSLTPVMRCFSQTRYRPERTTIFPNFAHTPRLISRH